jgi:acyl-CoA synthetase (AMP-forming)/AMP-acid ligase II
MASLSSAQDEYRRNGHWTGRSIYDIAREAAQTRPDLRVMDSQRELVLPEVVAASERLAQEFIAAGVGSLTRVFFIVSDPLADLTILLALSKVDAIVFIAPPGLSPREAARTLARSQAGIVIAGDGADAFVTTVEAECSGHLCLSVDALDGGVRETGAVAPARGEAPAEGVVSPLTRIVTFTSGSTGEPKGVQHCSDTMAYAGRWAVEVVDPAQGAIVSLISVAHAAGLAFSVMSALMHKRDLVLYRGKWDPDDAIALIRRSGGAWAMMIPTHLFDVVQRLSDRSERLDGFSVSVGGAAVSKELVMLADRAGIKACRVFGLSECLGHTATCSSDPLDLRVATEGRPFLGTEVVCNAGGHVLRTGDGEAGCRGPSLFLGYLGATEPPLSPDGFFMTGDHVRIDEAGCLTVLGRFKDIIIRGGENIDPSEIEKTLRGLRGVRGTVVVGYPDARLGEKVAAAIEADAGSLDTETVMEHLKTSGLAKFKWPERVVFLDELPRNPVGKIDRRQVKASLEGATHD